MEVHGPSQGATSTQTREPKSKKIKLSCDQLEDANIDCEEQPETESTGNQEIQGQEEELPTHFHFYKFKESNAQLFDAERVTFTLQDLADASSSESVIVSTAGSLQFQSTDDDESSSSGMEANDNHNYCSVSSSRTVHSSEDPEEGQEDDEIKSDCGLIMAGPTNPLAVEQNGEGVKSVKFTEEALHLKCDWEGCDFESRLIHVFSDHIVNHTPSIAVVNESKKGVKVFLICKWNTCQFKTALCDDLKRHLYLHAYHTKLKCLGLNAVSRLQTTWCRADGGSRNILPELTENLVCAWDTCTESFINIQMYYDHIHYHCQDNPAGKKVPGGIRCLWGVCAGIFNNKTKLADHLKSHTQEKVLACPNCGAFFSNRTRLLDHCRRQDEDLNYACDVCLKAFSTARLLREHVRSHINNYRCTECDMSVTSLAALASHKKYRHSEIKPFLCTTCNYAAKSQSDITRHMKNHGRGMSTCEVEGCPYVSKSASSLSSHYENVHARGGPKYQCHICQKLYFRGHSLTKHLVQAHKLQWPSGHSRFRYKCGEDSFYRLLTLRYESVDVVPSAAEAAAKAEAGTEKSTKS